MSVNSWVSVDGGELFFTITDKIFGYAFFVKIINIEVLKDFLVNWIQIFTEIIANFEVCSLY